MTCGGEKLPAGHYGDYLKDFIASFGVLETLGKEAMVLWLTIILTSGHRSGQIYFLLGYEIIAKSLKRANIFH